MDILSNVFPNNNGGESAMTSTAIRPLVPPTTHTASINNVRVVRKRIRYGQDSTTPLSSASLQRNQQNPTVIPPSSSSLNLVLNQECPITPPSNTTMSFNNGWNNISAPEPSICKVPVTRRTSSSGSSSVSTCSSYSPEESGVDVDDCEPMEFVKEEELSVFKPQLVHVELESLSTVCSRSIQYRGPTTESNWVIFNRMMMGAFPASLDDHQHTSILRLLLAAGIRTFVCLQDEYDHYATPQQWKSQQKIRPYIFDAAGILANSATNDNSSLELLHVAIKDCSVTTDSSVYRLAHDVCYRILSGEVLYIHCWGGHGRTGTLVAIVLGMLFGLDSDEALYRTQHFHDQRHSPLGVPSPQTKEQCLQVRRILSFHRSKHGFSRFSESLYQSAHILRSHPKYKSEFSIFKS